MLRETVNALKDKAAEEPVDPATYNRQSLKEMITNIEGLLDQFD